jgi:hypothetical protein
VICGCGHAWHQNDEGLTVRFDAESEDELLDEEQPEGTPDEDAGGQPRTLF